jgi:hypothetical protein
MTGTGTANTLNGESGLIFDGTNLGIGITPTAKLDLLIDTDKRLTFLGGIGEIGNVAGFQSINSAGSALEPFGIRAEDIRFATGSSERMRIDSSGNVGIGVSSISTQGQLYIGASGTSTDAKIALSPTNSSGGQNPLAQIGSTADGTYGSELYFTTRSTGATVSERMRIDSSGNVGIGTDNPNGKLDVVGDIKTSGEYVINSGTTAKWTIGQSSDELYFYAVSSGSERMRIDSSGNVGIGTNNPATKLHTYHSTNASDTLVFVDNLQTSQTGADYNKYGIVGQTRGADASWSRGVGVSGLGDAATFHKAIGVYAGLNTTLPTGFATDSALYADGNSLGNSAIFMNGNVGIGTVTPASYDNNAAGISSNLVVADSGHSGIIVISGTSSDAAISFGDGTGAAAYRGAVAYVNSQDALYFKSAGSNRMIIDSSGNVHINKTAVNQITTLGFDLYANGTVLSTHTVSNNESWIINNYNGSGTSRFDFRWNNSSRGGILVTSSATTFVSNSDYRLKENVNYDWDATTRLKQLKPARFNWIADDTNTLVDGFLAHEVTSIAPNAVEGIKDEVYDSEHELAGEPKYQQVDHSKLVPLLTKALQEQQIIIDDLKSRIEALEE